MDITECYQEFYSKFANNKKADFDRSLIQTSFEIKGVKTSELEKFAEYNNEIDSLIKNRKKKG